MTEVFWLFTSLNHDIVQLVNGLRHPEFCQMKNEGEYNSDERSRAVAWGLAVTKDTKIAPDAFERQLLDQYVRGILTIDEVIEHLEERELSLSHVENTTFLI